MKWHTYIIAFSVSMQAMTGDDVGVPFHFCVSAATSSVKQFLVCTSLLPGYTMSPGP